MRSQYTFGVYMDLNSVDVNTRPPKDKTSPRMKWLVVLPLLFQSAVAFSSLALLPTGNSARVARVERCHGGRQCLAPACATGALGLSSKTIAVFGSTGGVGLEAIYQSLGKGYEVRALARTPTNVVVPAGSGGDSKTGQSLSSTCLSIIQGDVTRYEDVAKVMQGGVDGVVVALGGRTSEVGTSMLTDGTRNIIKAMKEVGNTNKVSIVTSIGAGESYDQAPLLFKVIMWTVLKDAFVDKNNQVILWR